MGAPDEIHAAVLDPLNISCDSCPCHCVRPSGMILMNVGTPDLIRFSVQIKSRILVKPHRTDSEICVIDIFFLCSVIQFTRHPVSHRIFRRPESWFLHRKLHGHGL